MVAPLKRVVRSDLWIDGAFDECLAREKDVALRVFPVRGDDYANKDVKSGEAYHVLVRVPVCRHNEDFNGCFTSLSG